MEQEQLLETETPKKSYKTLWILAIFLIGLGVLGAAYYFTNTAVTDDNPPSLTVDLPERPGYQGLLKKQVPVGDNAYYTLPAFEESDKPAHEAIKKIWKDKGVTSPTPLKFIADEVDDAGTVTTEGNGGLHYIYSNEDTDLDKMVKSLKPEGKFVIGKWDSTKGLAGQWQLVENTVFGEKSGEGYKGKEIKHYAIDKLSEVKVKAGELVVLLATTDTEIYGAYEGNATAENNFNVCIKAEQKNSTGFYGYAMDKDMTAEGGLYTSLSSCLENIESVHVQSQVEPKTKWELIYKKTDEVDTGTEVLEAYAPSNAFVWVKFKSVPETPVVAANPTVPTVELMTANMVDGVKMEITPPEVIEEGKIHAGYYLFLKKEGMDEFIGPLGAEGENEYTLSLPILQQQLNGVYKGDTIYIKVKATLRNAENIQEVSYSGESDVASIEFEADEPATITTSAPTITLETDDEGIKYLKILPPEDMGGETLIGYWGNVKKSEESNYTQGNIDFHETFGWDESYDLSQPVIIEFDQNQDKMFVPGVAYDFRVIPKYEAANEDGYIEGTAGYLEGKVIFAKNPIDPIVTSAPTVVLEEKDSKIVIKITPPETIEEGKTHTAYYVSWKKNESPTWSGTSLALNSGDFETGYEMPDQLIQFAFSDLAEEDEIYAKAKAVLTEAGTATYGEESQPASLVLSAE